MECETLLKCVSVPFDGRAYRSFPAAIRSAVDFLFPAHRLRPPVPADAEAKALHEAMEGVRDIALGGVIFHVTAGRQVSGPSTPLRDAQGVVAEIRARRRGGTSGASPDAGTRARWGTEAHAFHAAARSIADRNGGSVSRSKVPALIAAISDSSSSLAANHS